MGTSWIGAARRFKSRSSVAAGFLLRSRETGRERIRRLRAALRAAEAGLAEARRALARCTAELEACRAAARRQRAEAERRGTEAVALPPDPPVGRHGYGPRMVELAVNLARRIGLRGAATAIRLLFDWLRRPEKTPHWTAIRGWLLRLGVARIEEPPEQADDWVWLADHSNQIGQEKLLAVLAVRSSALPAAGTALTHRDVRVLCLQPGTQWKRTDMARTYAELAERHGAPRALLTDGAVELRDGAAVLRERRPDFEHFRDLKHFAANRLEALLGADPRFAEFLAAVGRTRAAIQQTELAHLAPPGLKTKARFMNLAPLLRWATMTDWTLREPTAPARADIDAERLESRLGWLRSFAAELARWADCQRVVSAAVAFAAEQGLSPGAADALRTTLGESPCDAGRRLTADLLAFVAEAEARLRPGERLPLGTEILESTFGLFKQLEGQHSKGGFTSLIAAFAALPTPTTADEITQAFARVGAAQTRDWIARRLPRTVSARRTQAYRDHTQARRATKTVATT